MAKKADIHIVRKPDTTRWQVKQSGDVQSSHRTQQAAIERGTTRARRDKVDVVVHGNTNKREVHDQQKEDTRPSGCQIDEFLKAGHGVYFRPDTLAQAKSEQYDNCAKCIGGSLR